MEKGLTRMRERKKEPAPDWVDMKILEMLREDGRMSFASIGRKLGLSKPTVKYRVERLIRTKVIRSFFTLVDSQVYGVILSVVFDLTVEPQRVQEAASRTATYPEVVRVYELTNTPQLHVHALFTDNDAMERFMRNKLYRLPGIKDVNTGIILRRYKTDLTLTV